MWELIWSKLARYLLLFLIDLFILYYKLKLWLIAYAKALV